jgi:hypothetical protein
MDQITIVNLAAWAMLALIVVPVVLRAISKLRQK